MAHQSSYQLGRFRLDREQLLFLLLIAVCAVLLVSNLMRMSVVWDETPHLYGGLLLFEGNIDGYFGFTRYPPLMDSVTAVYFTVFGADVFAARLVSVTFALLTICVLYKLASETYGRRIALLSSVFLATMPGFIWLSNLTLLEMTLEFFFVASLLLFVYWLHSGRNIALMLSGLLLGLAFLTKYQGLVAGLVILASLPFVFYRSQFRAKLSRFPLLIVATAVIVIPACNPDLLFGVFSAVA